MQQFPFIDLFKSALHVSSDVFAHPQEQFNCMYSFGNNAPTCCRPVTLITEKWTRRRETVTTNGLIPFRIMFMKMLPTTMNYLLLQKLVTLRTETMLQRN
jgi:hypothetical protein